MAAGIDTGAIAYQSLFNIEAADTPVTLMSRCVDRGMQLITHLLDDAARVPPSIPAHAQDLSRRSYHGREIPNSGALSWSWSAAKVNRFVRACRYDPFHSPWGHPRARWAEKPIEILDTSLTGEASTETPGCVRIRNQSCHVACGDEWIRLLALRADGKKYRAADLLEDGCRLQEVSP
jgi:methionyl-tRNA formyltransferase